MKKIITSGKKEFIAVCNRCGCKFSYELEDVLWNNVVKCPECNEHVSHIVPHELEFLYQNVPYSAYQNIPYSIPCTESGSSEDTISTTYDNYDDVAVWTPTSDGFYCSKCLYKAESTAVPTRCPQCHRIMNIARKTDYNEWV